MPSESGERRSVRAPKAVASHPPPNLTEPLPCPRCDSTNTKFCYYNNYNLSQPRHFCKGCRRYWTHGGTLRNVPVGGGSRKNTKRSRPSSSSTSTSSSSTTSTSTLSTFTHEQESLPVPVTANHDNSVLSVAKDEISDGWNMENLPVSEPGNFLSLLNIHGPAGLMGVTGYGPGFGFGFCEEELGFGGRGVWPYPGTGYAGGGISLSGCTWQQVGDAEGGEGGSDGGLVDGDGFVWPDHAISTPGKGLK